MTDTASDIFLGLGANGSRQALALSRSNRHGLIAGATLVFASAATAFISQSVIGGGRLNYLPALVWQQAMVVFDWPLAAAMALTLMGSVLMVVGALNLLGRNARHA